MSCQISTDSPKEAPNDSATVPTMTNAATRDSGDEHHDEQNQAQRGDSGDHEVVFGTVLDVLVGRGGAG